MTVPSSADVVVVGAGLAGLVAAGRLQEAGLDVVLVEQSDGVGGRVRTDVVDGFRLDRGFQLLNPAYPEARTALDLEALDLQPFLAGLVVCLGSKRYALGDPLRLPTAIRNDLTAPIGSMKEKLAFATWVAGLGLGSARPIRDADYRPLIEELRARGIGGALTDRVLRPFLSGVLGEGELATSAAYVRLVWRAFAIGTIAVPAAGMGAIPAQLAAGLPDGVLRLGRRVEAVRAGAVRVDGDELSARAVVVATDPVTASALLPGVAAPRMYALTTLYFVAPAPPAHQPTLHLDGTGGPLANTVVLTEAAPGYSPDHRALVSSSFLGTADRVPETVVRRELGRLYGVATDGWEHLHTAEIPRALPALPAASPLRRDVVLGDGVFVAGDHRDTPSQQGALVSGRRAAQAVLAHLGV
jgi:phytoene dehydrogenase-like protein